MDLFRLLLISLTSLYSRANSSLFRATAATDTNTHTHTHTREGTKISRKRNLNLVARTSTHTLLLRYRQMKRCRCCTFSTLLAAGTEFFRGQRVHTFADERTARVIHNAISVRYSLEYSSLFSRNLFSSSDSFFLVPSDEGDDDGGVFWSQQIQAIVLPLPVLSPAGETIPATCHSFLRVIILQSAK